MAVIIINNFGGEIPRMKPAALPPGAAVRNQNLVATSTEFRPTLAPKVIDTTNYGNAKTLFRRARDSGGNLLTNDTADWQALPYDVNLVKGHINDDTTERYYSSDNTGASPMQTGTASESHLLGVPPPSKIAVTVPAKNYLNYTQASTWLSGTFAPAVKSAIQTALDARYNTYPWQSRYDPVAGTSVAGPTSIDLMQGIMRFENASNVSARGMSAPEPWNVFGVVPNAFTTYFDTSFLGAVIPPTDTGHTWFAVNVLPSWPMIVSDSQVDQSLALKNALMTIVDPLDATKKFFVDDFYTGGPPAGVSKARSVLLMCQVAVEYMKPSFWPEVTALRSSLQTAYNDWVSIAEKAIRAAAQVGTPAAPHMTFNGATYYTVKDAAAAEPQGQFAWKTVTITSQDYDGISTNTGATTTVRTDAWNTWNVAYQQFLSDMRTSSGNLTDSDFDKASVTAAMSKAAEKCASISRQIEKLHADLMDGLIDKIVALFTGYGMAITASTPNAVFALNDDKIIDDRFYVGTWVTAIGEESAPGAVSDLVEVDQYDTPILTLPTSGPTYPHWTGLGSSYPVAKFRIYRSNAGTDTAAFQLVADLPFPFVAGNGVTLGPATFTDAVPSGKLAGTLPTTYWSLPPVRLDASGNPKGADPWPRGLVRTSNGLACFLDNGVYFNEPGYDYAWPERYRKTVAFPVVGLGVFGETVFVGTDGQPTFFVGSDPANMARYDLPDKQACVSRRSIVSDKGGIWYASQNGYCFATPNGVEVATVGLWSDEDWLALDPSSIIAAVFANTLHFWYNGHGNPGYFGLDMVARKLVSGHAPDGQTYNAPTAVFLDPTTQALFLAGAAGIYRMFGGTTHNAGDWKSGIITLPKEEGFAWLKVEGDQTPDTPITVKWWGDSALQYTWTITDDSPTRVPDGRFLRHQLEIIGAARVTRVTLASSTEELKAS